MGVVSAILMGSWHPMCEGRPDRIRIRPTSRDPTMVPAWRIAFEPAHHAAFEIIQPARERHVAARAPEVASPDRFQADLPASSATASCCSDFQRLCADTASGNTAIPDPPYAACVACVAQAWCRTREDRQNQPIFARNKGSSPSLARYPGLTMNGACLPVGVDDAAGRVRQAVCPMPRIARPARVVARRAARLSCPDGPTAPRRP